MLSFSETKVTTWQTAYTQLITDVGTLLTHLHLTTENLELAETALNFPLRVPLSFVKRMQVGNPYDPLLLQVLPQASEQVEKPGFISQPLREQCFVKTSNLLHKYQGRALWLVTGACAIHCRYCFRQNFPYQEHTQARKDWHLSLHYLRANPDIHEIILSGGDPLSAKDSYLAALVEKLAEIQSLHTLRIHTRLPIVLPERITSELIQWLCHSRLKPVIVLHCNHPNELNDEVSYSLQQLRNHQVLLLNQAVLLKGINDDIHTLKALSEKLFAFGILPYYLHQLDPVQGAAHFEVSRSEALALHQQLNVSLPGYLVPKLVYEQPGAKAKVSVY